MPSHTKPFLRSLLPLHPTLLLLLLLLLLLVVIEVRQKIRLTVTMSIVLLAFSYNHTKSEIRNGMLQRYADDFGLDGLLC